MTEKVLAGVTLLVCLVLLLRLMLGRPRQQRFDAAARRSWFWIKVKAVTLWRWRSLRREADQAARDAIARASGRPPRTDEDGEWKGNIYTPKGFRKPRKPH